MDNDVDRRRDVRDAGVTVIELVKLAIEPLKRDIVELKDTVREGFSGSITREEVERRIADVSLRLDAMETKRVEAQRWIITTIVSGAIVVATAIGAFATLHH